MQFRAPPPVAPGGEGAGAGADPPPPGSEMETVSGAAMPAKTSAVVLVTALLKPAVAAASFTAAMMALA